ncbi:hypothetical protein C8Q70DRAFT_239195 [Cubamyces menziesii]|nr:hypothetical protein C8Q70DRAFT_239195 [Cubamyces menziesii]
MDVARARSPPASLGRRPIGPRSPGKPGSSVPRNIIPLDLSARLQEEVPSLYSSPEPTAASSSSRAASPALNVLAVPPSNPLVESQEPQHTHPEETKAAQPHEPQTTHETPPQPEPQPEVQDQADEVVYPTRTATPASPSSPKDSSPVPEDSAAVAPVSIPPPSPPSEPEAEPVPSSPPTPRTDASRPHSTVQAAAQDAVEAVPSSNGHSRTLSEKSVQANLPGSSPSAAGDAHSSTPASTRASTPALVRVVSRRPPLAPPPALNFDVEPIPWKGLTLEAAQWTFTSEQLQETVSRAIRHSASESFIRVVPMQTFDVELPQELERLDSLKATTQSQYRFSMHRRTMLLQSLAALSQTDGADGEALYNLTSQLAELTVACDRLMETLVRIADQRAQIQRVQDLHISSALSMALRKLNTSYAKRTAELQEARAHNEELKAELEEAWTMAQDMAQEMDDLDNFDLTFSDDEMFEDEHHDADALEAEIYNDMDRMSAVVSVQNAEVVEITGKAVATKATLVPSMGAPQPRLGDRASRVSAAKKRSSRASKASLRIPKTPTNERGEGGSKPDRSSIYSIHSRSRSKSVRRRSERAASEVASPAGEDVPEVPIIRIPDPVPKKEGSFLELVETRPVSPAASAVSDQHTPTPPPPPLPAGAVVAERRRAVLGEVGEEGHDHLGQITSSPTEDATSTVSAPPPSTPTTFDSMNIPTISLHTEEAPAKPASSSSSWRSRKFFSRRVHSMQPPLLRAASSDDASAPPLKRSISEVKQFDGWPAFLGGSGGGQKSQRFSVPVLSVIQPLKGRSSTDSAPAASSSRLSSSSSR